MDDNGFHPLFVVAVPLPVAFMLMFPHVAILLLLLLVVVGSVAWVGGSLIEAFTRPLPPKEDPPRRVDDGVMRPVGMRSQEEVDAILRAWGNRPKGN